MNIGSCDRENYPSQELSKAVYRMHAMKSTNNSKDDIGYGEVASAAHVSRATVSRVLDGNCRVDRAIQKAVLDAVAKLDVDLFQRNKTKALVISRSPLHPFHTQILIG